MKKDKNKNEFNPYATDKLAKIPSWIKVLFLKYWVAAATLFFFGIGNPLIISEGMKLTANAILPIYIFLALGLGLLSEYITKQFIRLMKTSTDNTYRFNLVNGKGIKSLVLNIIYAFIILIPMLSILVFLARHNLVFDVFAENGQKAAIEPFTGGFVYIFLDAVFVSIKNFIVYQYKNHKYNVINKQNEELVKKLEELSDEDLIYLDNIQKGVKPNEL